MQCMRYRLQGTDGDRLYTLKSLNTRRHGWPVLAYISAVLALCLRTHIRKEELGTFNQL